MKGCIDVVLTDLNMPGESGCDLAHWIADNCPSTRTILMSSETTNVCEDCPLERRCPFLQKPFGLTQAIKLVDEQASAAASEEAR